MRGITTFILIIFFGALPGPVQAADDLIRPASGWNLSRAGLAAQPPYCTISREYPGNIYLSFARNAAGATSLAVDFPGTVNPEGVYDLSLKAGNRVLNASSRPPDSETSFVFQFKEPSFFEAIRKAKMLELDLSGTLYRLALPDMIEANASLQVCVEQGNRPLQAQVSDVRTPLGTSSSPAPESRTSQDDLLLESLRQENARLKAALLKQKETLKDSYGEGAGQETALQELEEKIALLKTQNEDLRRQIRTGVQAGAFSAKTRPPTSQDEYGGIDYKKEIADYKNRLQAMHVRVRDLEQVRAQLQEQLAHKSSAFAADQNNCPQKQPEPAEETVSASGSAAAVSAGTVDFVKAQEIKLLKNKLAALKDENGKLRKDLASVRADLESRRLSDSDGNWDLETATRRYNELERELERIGLQREQEQAACKEDKIRLEAMLFDPAAASKEQRRHLMDLEEALSTANARLADQAGVVAEKVREEIGDVLAENEELKRQNADLIQQAKNLKERNGGYEARLISLEQVLASLRERLSRTQDALAAATAEAGDAKAKGQALASGKEELIRSLQEDLADLRREKETMASRITGLTAEVAETGLSRTKASRDLEASRHNYDKMERDLKRLREERKDLETELSSTRGVVSDLQKEVAKLKEERLSRKPDRKLVWEEPKLAAAQSTRPVSSVSRLVPDVTALLKQAGIATDVPPRPSDPGAAEKAWRWQAGNVVGNAELYRSSDMPSLESFADRFIGRARQRCVGDFAVSRSYEGEGLVGYEIACVVSPDGQEGSGAALLFVQEETAGRYLSFAHEAGMPDMEAAMDARDRLARLFLQ